MPTFLELCVTTHKECKVAGTITTTVGQSGRLLDIVRFVQKANRKIQRRRIDWNYLWSEWTLTLVKDIGEYSPPTAIGSFDRGSFWLDAGTTDAAPLEYVDWRRFRDSLKNEYIETDEVSFVALKPNGQVAVLPVPDSDCAGKIISCEYWKAPVELTSDSQVSLIPPQFHDAITSQAKVYMAEKISNSGLYASASVEHEQVYIALKAHSLPGNQRDGMSESDIPLVAVVQ